MFEAIKRSLTGLGFAAIFTFSILTFFMVQGIEVSVGEIWKNMLGSMLMGVYFGSASLLYDIEEWSPLKQTVIHFLISITIWLPVAVLIGWIPVDTVLFFIGFGVFVVSYLVFWYCTKVYLKKLEQKMNNSI